ncbi:MAG: phosphoenolpyruvate hydrolase family protein [Actinomycetota bacterium]|nr:phosphoenolpyruvate hydrolase family protein [Actinomycetota bacterium]
MDRSRHRRHAGPARPERLPTERALTEQTRAFEAVKF